jgi:hypothetical protein
MDQLYFVEFLVVPLLFMLGAMIEMATAIEEDDIPRLSLWTGVATVSAYLPMML